MAKRRRYAGEDVEARRGDRRRRFIDAGLEIFAGRGYAGTSVPAVCREAGLSSRQFYEEFPNREALLAAIYTESHSEAIGLLTSRLSAAFRDLGHSEVEAIIELGIGSYLEYFTRDLRRIKVCFIEVVGVSPEFENRRRDTRELWAQSLADVTDLLSTQGVVDGRDRKFDWTVFLGAVNAAVVEYATRPDFVDTEVVSRTLLRIIRGGILG